MIIEATAPTRVDLAGGTIDIWPLYLFHPGATTVNFAISLYARCRIETRDDDRVILESRDRQVSFDTRLADIEHLAHEERLELIAKLVHFFQPETGFHLIAEGMAPAGRGLGRVERARHRVHRRVEPPRRDRYPEEKFIMLAANVETTVIRVPAGFQDYYGAFYGGANSIHFRADGIRREALDVDSATLEAAHRHLLHGRAASVGDQQLGDVQEPHRRRPRHLRPLRGHPRRRRARCARRSARTTGRGWARSCARLPEPQAARARTSRRRTWRRWSRRRWRTGALAAKVCGAGGGGCIAFLCDEGARESVERALAQEEGAEVLRWKFAPDGLAIRES